MFKKVFSLSLISFFLISFSFSYSQTQRNPVLEYCTGAWCQWCPCGHTIISQNILPSIPNAIILGYHGPANTSSDPFSTFSGNQIISALSMSSYPTGIVDRTSAPISRSAWLSTMTGRVSVPATVDINILKTFNATTKVLQVTLHFTALTSLTGDFKYNLVLTEDNLRASQTGNSSCTGGTDYNHSHVVRAMINGYLGELVNTGSTWAQGTTFTKEFSYTVPDNFVPAECHISAFVYKVGTTLNTSEIQQAKQWRVIGDIVPVEMVTFNATVSGNGINLTWKTASELNNFGFEIERSYDGLEFHKIGFANGGGSTADERVYNFIDNFTASTATSLFYRLKQLDYDGHFEYSDVINVLYDIPTEFSMEQNFPNPFNPSTTINYSLATNSRVSIKVYNMLGKEVSELINKEMPSGKHSIEFNAAHLSSGIYIVEMNAGSFNAKQKISLLK